MRIIYKHSDGHTIEKSEIILYKEGSSTIAQLSTNGKITKQVAMSEGYLPIIPRFVNELDTLTKEKKCGIVDSYLVYIDNRLINRIDRSCEWNGFKRLKYALFFDH